MRDVPCLGEGPCWGDGGAGQVHGGGRGGEVERGLGSCGEGTGAEGGGGMRSRMTKYELPLLQNKENLPLPEPGLSP